LLLFCVRNESRCGEATLRAGRFTVNILAEHQEQIAMHFSGRKDVTVNCELVRQKGFVWLVDSNAVFRCEVEASHPGGDHRIIVGCVVDLHRPEECECLLIYHEGQYAQIPPGQAVTSQAEVRSS
jgi:3-hydroxy-9,10-secoandrosta-1,3,5(10)-triene-9,17-dione monooxygenase reductase component